MGIQTDSVRSDLSTLEVSVRTTPSPPPPSSTSALEELLNFVVSSDWLWLCDSEINERGLLYYTTFQPRLSTHKGVNCVKTSRGCIHCWPLATGDRLPSFFFARSPLMSACNTAHTSACSTPHTSACSTPHTSACNTPHTSACNTAHMSACNTPHVTLQHATRHPATQHTCQPATRHTRQPATRHTRQPATQHTRQPATRHTRHCVMPNYSLHHAELLIASCRTTHCVMPRAVIDVTEPPVWRWRQTDINDCVMPKV